MLGKIQKAIADIDVLSTIKPLMIVGHYDADGISAAAIFARALQRWRKRFSLRIVKGLEEDFIRSLPEDHLLIFLDLASGSLRALKEKKTEIFIFDHHEIVHEIPDNVTMINPLLEKHEMISGAGICYLFAKMLSPENRDLAHLAVIGMVGDVLEKEIGKVYDTILKDADAHIRKGLLLYPSTRPLDKVLEYSSNPYIPGVSGSYAGSLELLRDANIQKSEGRYKSLLELTNEEMSRLITAIILRSVSSRKSEDLIGHLYLVKFFNKQEDAREFSALVNACSRMDQPHISLGFCLGNKRCKEEAEKAYITYKQHLVSALRTVAESEKISGKDYTIINAKDKIKDTIIGTVASIISQSLAYPEGTMIIALAYNEDKIKVSARIVGKEGRNVRDVLHRAVISIGGEVGGHPNAAGCLISKTQEVPFLEELKKVLEVDVINTLPAVSQK